MGKLESKALYKTSRVFMLGLFRGPGFVFIKYDSLDTACTKLLQTEKIQVLSACWRASKCFKPNTVCVSLKAAILDLKVLSPWTERYYFSHRVRGMP